MKKSAAIGLTFTALLMTSAAPPADYSVLIHGGTIYDGTGGNPYVGDVALKGDKIAYVGPHAPGTAASTAGARRVARGRPHPCPHQNPCECPAPRPNGRSHPG